MEGPIITVDVSKGSCHYQPFIENGHPMRKPKQLSATIDGFQKLGQTIKDLEAKTEREDIPVIFEATGVYHRPLQKYLEDHKIRYYIISPLLSATYRKTDLHSNKTDALDCAHIAKAYYCEKELRQYQAQPQEYKRLYQLSRIYESELVHLRKRKVSLRSMLDIIYPRIDKTFKGNQNLYDPIPMEILKRYPHPSLLLSHREDTIVKTVGHRTGHLKGYTERIVHKIYEKAKECYSGCEINDIEVINLPRLIENVQEQKKKCDSLLKEMIEIARTCPYFASVVSIVGIGENLAARIIAELGDVNRFDNRAAQPSWHMQGLIQRYNNPVISMDCISRYQRKAISICDVFYILVHNVIIDCAKKIHYMNLPKRKDSRPNAHCRLKLPILLVLINYWS